MPAPFSLPASLQGFLDRRPGSELQKIHAEASRRSFYRIRQDKKTLVAMVYPGPAPVEIERFGALQKLYRELGLRVPRIDRVLDDQVVLQEDLGDLLLQRAWRASGRERRLFLLDQCREILAGLAAIPAALATARLDPSRRKWEMDFFVTHFFPHFPRPAVRGDDLRRQLHCLVEAVAPESAFAHRDFHSRNLLVLKQGLAMVDFQDSLVAPRYYDLVSLAFDSYLDLGADRGRLFPNLAAGGDDRELRQLRLTALQRNIKALGTFAYQIFERRHKVYARYIPRTLRHIRSHLQALNEPRFNVLAKYFNSVTR